MDRLNATWRGAGKHEFQTRIGLHTSLAITGVLGSRDRLAYTAFGDTVNVASRIEVANKAFGTRLLISETTHAELHGRLATRRVELVALKGRQAPLQVYELLEG